MASKALAPVRRWSYLMAKKKGKQSSLKDKLNKGYRKMKDESDKKRSVVDKSEKSCTCGEK